LGKAFTFHISSLVINKVYHNVYIMSIGIINIFVPPSSSGVKGAGVIHG